MTDASLTIPIIDSVGDIGARYRAWLVDIWGVMHNGQAAFAQAAAANADDPATHVLAELAATGVPVRVIGAGATGRLGATRWRWLHPPAGWSSPESNDASMAIEITAGSRRVLLLGDAEDAAMRAIGFSLS